MSLHPAPGFMLLELVEPPTKSKLSTSRELTESNYGKVLDWGLPLMTGDGLIQLPRIAVETDEDGQGGKERKLKKGDVVVFDERTARKMSDEYSSGPPIVQVRFDYVLSLFEEENVNASH